MLPTVLSMASDSVANVRFNVAKTLQKIGPQTHQTHPTQMQTKIIFLNSKELSLHAKCIEYMVKLGNF